MKGMIRICHLKCYLQFVAGQTVRSISFARATLLGYTGAVGVAEDRSRNAIEGSKMPCLGEDVLRSQGLGALNIVFRATDGQERVFYPNFEVRQLSFGWMLDVILS
jgi:hypothetical protein